MSEASAAGTHAILVGIERYKASWDLDGPASDAVRLAEYLHRRGVPNANMTVALAPLAANTTLIARAQAVATSVVDPTQSVIDDLIEEKLRTLKAGLLLFFWAGHGLITVSDQRRLYTADATAANKRNLDLNAMMEALRSDRYPNLPRQAFIVDTCANYIPNAEANLAHRTYAAGAGVAGREQFAIYAASPGEYALNLGAEKSGLLSRELLALLEQEQQEPPWPPDFTVLANRLAERFIQLRQEGKSRQSPATFWFRGPTQSGKFLSKFSAPAAAVAARLPRVLKASEYMLLVDAFMRLDISTATERRDAIVRQLRPEIAGTIKRAADARSDIIAIIDRCRSYNALAELLDAIQMFVGTASGEMQELNALARQLLPEEVPEQLN